MRDQGTGIPPEEVDAIFHPFRGSFGRGTGLGLAIVHRIVTDYNGRIDVQSAVGRGTTIVVTFPAPRGRRPAGAATEETDPAMAAVPPQKPRILVVDDERSLREMLSIVLGREGYEVATAENVGAALDQIRRGPVPDILISDLRMPDGSGVDVLRALKERSPGSVGPAAHRVRLGRHRRRGDAAGRRRLPDQALRRRRPEAAGRPLPRDQAAEREPGGAVGGPQDPGFVLAGRSRQILDVISLVARVARTDASVLITGESGTGKEWTAREIHQQSSRQAQPFVAVNCGAFTESILESELFGHMKGSFTGAVDTKKGLLEAADRGTLFLDEVGETSLGMQVKLLRVLQERRFRRVGGTQELEADVRFIAATNRNLEEMVRTGSFREDFFFRINVISVRLPALRERAEDIPILAEQFVQRFSERMGRPVRAHFRRDDAAAHRPTAGRATCASSRTSSSAAWRSSSRPSCRPTACRRTCARRPAAARPRRWTPFPPPASTSRPTCSRSSGCTSSGR